MPTVTLFRNDYAWTIPPRGPNGHVYFWLEHPLFGRGAVTVTAVATYAPERYLEVTQLATRGDYAGRFYLDIVVTNNGPITVSGFYVHTSVISP
ncbi:hypothetical protein [Sphaerisporangium dianthi]|uniref:Uncharacterized protein n=1 Tax=Sphaerisporangium dianthi TaxID=1436120 RepID=A0ABV9C9B4_9ACTN